MVRTFAPTISVVLPYQRSVLRSLECAGCVHAERVRALVPKEEVANTTHTESHKPIIFVLEEFHVCVPLQSLLRHEPLRRHAPPARLKRKDEEFRVDEP